MTVFKLILRRFLQQFGRTFTYWIVLPIVVVLAINVFLAIAAYIECRALGKVTTFTRGFPSQAYVCNSDP